MTNKLNRLIRIISKNFSINKELLYLTLKYDSKFFTVLDCACDYNVDVKKLCQYLKNNSDIFQLNFNN